MSVESAQEVLRDAFERVHGLVGDLTGRLPPDVANYRVDSDANSISWLLWHLSRVQDDHVADLAGVEQAWPHWRERFDLPLDDWDTGYSHSPAQVGSVRPGSALLAGYHEDVHQLTLRYLDQLDDEELARVVDTRWDPPVTASARLVSVIGDTMQHLGQAAYVRGLVERQETS
jgi:uncharacterized damage-inducible protein DinB